MRCTKCKKKYDDTLDFCPKCGMENTTGLRGEEREHRFIKEKFVEEPKLDYKENNASKEKNTGKIQKSVEKYDKWAKSDDKNSPFEKIKRGEFSVLKDSKNLNAQCTFCGTLNMKTTNNCVFCKSKNNEKAEERINSSFRPDSLKDVINVMLNKTEKTIDFDEFDQDCKRHGYDTSNWKSFGVITYGKPMGLIARFTSIGFISLYVIYKALKNFRSVEESYLLIPFIILAIVLYRLVAKKIYSEKVIFTNHDVIGKEQKGRSEKTIYEFPVDKLQKVTLIIKNAEKSRYVMMDTATVAFTGVGKKGLETKGAEIHEYSDLESLVIYTFMYCRKNNIQLDIHKNN